MPRVNLNHWTSISSQDSFANALPEEKEMSRTNQRLCWSSVLLWLSIGVPVPLAAQQQEEKEPVFALHLKGEKFGVLTRSGEVWIGGEKAGSIQANGEIWVAGEKEGVITDKGEIWKAGDKVGSLTDKGEVWKGGEKVGDIERDGTVWIQGERNGSFEKGASIPHVAIVFFYEFFPLPGDDD